jgi:HEAT repeat protein
LTNPGTSDLLDRLRSSDPAVVAPAIVEAEKVRAFEAAPIIAELLRSPDEAIRSSAAEALGCVGVKAPTRYGEALLSLLRDSVSFVRSCAAEALGGLAYEPAIPGLERLVIADGDELVRTSALEALGAFDGPRVLAIAERASDDPDPTVRAYAVRVIALKGDDTFLPMLKKRLDVESAFHPRAALLGARYLLGSNDDLRPLLDLLTDADIEQSTIVLNVLWDIIEEAPAASIVRDAVAIRKTLTQAKERNELVGRHSDDLLKALAKRLGVSRN